MKLPKNQAKLKNLTVKSALAFGQLYQLACAEIAPDLTIVQKLLRDSRKARARPKKDPASQPADRVE